MEPQDRLPKHWSPLSKLPLLLDKTYLGNKTANTTRSNSELKTQGKLDPMLGLKFLFSRKFGSLHHNSESRPGYWKELFTRPASAFDVSAPGWLGRGSPLEAGSRISCSSCRSSRTCRCKGWWRTRPGPEPRLRFKCKHCHCNMSMTPRHIHVSNVW